MQTELSKYVNVKIHGHHFKTLFSSKDVTCIIGHNLTSYLYEKGKRMYGIGTLKFPTLITRWHQHVILFAK